MVLLGFSFRANKPDQCWSGGTADGGESTGGVVSGGMATAIAGRCAFWLAMATVANSATAARTASPTRIAGVFWSTGYHGRISSSRLIRRELSSLLPAHSAVASACLVSKLPSEVNSSVEGRFSNYVIPI